MLSYMQVFGLSISVTDVGYMCISTIMSVSAHEFGHALAAARLSFMPSLHVIKCTKPGEQHMELLCS